MIRSLLDKHGVHPNQAYGQHFLVDPNIIERIVRLSSVGPGSQVVEIGGGTGTLTAGLAAAGAEVVVYEIDAGLVRVLSDTVGRRQSVEIRHADAGNADLSRDLGPGTWVLVSNLPYNVGTGIVLDALRQASNVERLVVLVQREVADRMLAPPGTRSYGLPSVIVALHATGKKAFTVGSEVFYPKPGVASTVVDLVRHPAPQEAERAIEIASVVFGQRRKMLRRSLADVLPGAQAVLERCGVDPTARPEELGPDAYLAIAREAVR